jgi:hypothetical protein
VKLAGGRTRIVCSTVSLFLVGAPLITSWPVGSARAAPSDAVPVVSQVWAKRFNGYANDSDAATAIGVSADGARVFVTGSSIRASRDFNFDYATVAYSASTGAWLWAKRYNGPGNGPDLPESLGVSPDGTTAFVTGWSDGKAGNYDFTTIAYEATSGATRWVARYDGPSHFNDVAHSLVVSRDGTHVYVTGGSDTPLGDSNFATVAYDASTGSQLWVKRYQGQGKKFDEAVSIGVDPSGTRVFVTGFSENASRDVNYATVAYDASTGAWLWTKRYNGPGFRADFPTALGVSPDGSAVFVTGWSQSSSIDSDYATVAYDASSGTQRWVKRYDGPAHDNDDASSVGVSPDGTKVFVTGDSVGLSSRDYATIAYNASTGHQLWARRYVGQRSAGTASALAVGPDGTSVFVTGWSWSSTSQWNYATIAYSPLTGHQLWAKRYNGQGNGDDLASAIVARPDGRGAFVTGRSIGSSTAWDFATIAYSTN